MLLFLNSLHSSKTDISDSGSDRRHRGLGLLLYARCAHLSSPSAIISILTLLWSVGQYPETATFLTDSERRHIVALLAEDSKNLAKGYSHKYFWQAIKDYKSWMQIVVYMGYVSLCLS